MKFNIKTLFGLMTIAVLAGCGSSDTSAILSEKDPVPVQVQEIKISTSSGRFQYTGKVISDDQTILGTKLLGQISHIGVEEGDKVTKGQLLVRIKSQDIDSKLASTKAVLKEAQAAEENTRRNYQRINNLYEKGSATQREMDDITTNLAVATARAESIEQQILELQELLTYANLRSPINGFVSQKFMNPGDMASPGHPIIALESMEKLKIDINVPEFEIGLFNTGDQVSVFFDAIKGKVFRGSVERVIPSTAFSGAQFKVSIVVEEADPSIKPGMYGKVSMLKGSSDKITIPEEAIYRKGQLQGVYVVSNQNEALLRWLRLGRQDENGFEVLSGIDPGEKIVVSSTSKLIDGQPIQITN